MILSIIMFAFVLLVIMELTVKKVSADYCKMLEVQIILNKFQFGPKGEE